MSIQNLTTFGKSIFSFKINSFVQFFWDKMADSKISDISWILYKGMWHDNRTVNRSMLWNSSKLNLKLSYKFKFIRKTKTLVKIARKLSPFDFLIFLIFFLLISCNETKVRYEQNVNFCNVTDRIIFVLAMRLVNPLMIASSNKNLVDFEIGLLVMDCRSFDLFK